MSLSKSNYLENEILKHLFRTASFTKPTALGIALLKTLPSADDGTGIAELTMGSYARVSRAPLDANWKDPSTATQGEVNNTADADWGTLTGTMERAIGVAIFDATSGGNLLYYGPLADNFRMFTGKASADELRAVGHGLSNGNRVFLRIANGLAGLSQQTEYFVVGAAADTFQVSLTLGGAAVDITSDGFGEVGDSKARDINGGDSIKFVANQLKVNED